VYRLKTVALRLNRSIREGRHRCCRPGSACYMRGSAASSQIEPTTFPDAGQAAPLDIRQTPEASVTGAAVCAVLPPPVLAPGNAFARGCTTDLSWQISGWSRYSTARQAADRTTSYNNRTAH